MRVEKIPLGKIIVNENFNVLLSDSRYEEERIKELATSIRAVGLINPVTVVKKDGGYVLVDGHRRYMAYKILAEKWPKKYSVIPAVVIDKVDDIAVIVNELAEKYTPSTLARLAKKFNDDGISITKIARAIGKSKGYVSMLVKIAGNDDALKMLDEGVDVRITYELMQVADKNLRKKLMEKVRGKSRASALRIIRESLNKRVVKKDIMGEPDSIHINTTGGLTVKPPKPGTPKTAQCFICGRVYDARDLQAVHLCGRDAILLNKLLRIIREKGYTLDEAISRIERWKPKLVVKGEEHCG